MAVVIPVCHITLFNETANFTVADDTICTSQLATFQTTGINTANIATYFGILETVHPVSEVQ